MSTHDTIASKVYNMCCNITTGLLPEYTGGGCNHLRDNQIKGLIVDLEGHIIAEKRTIRNVYYPKYFNLSSDFRKEVDKLLRKNPAFGNSNT